MLHEELPRLVGGVVYRLRPEDLAGRYLSDFRLEKVSVDLTPDEKAEHDRNYGAFTSYLEETSTRLDSPDAFRRFIMRTATDPAARRALLARNRALSIAFNSEAKLDRLEGILRTSSDDDRTIVFTEHNDLVYRISRRFLLPFITHATGKEEREEGLQGGEVPGRRDLEGARRGDRRPRGLGRGHRERDGQLQGVRPAPGAAPEKERGQGAGEADRARLPGDGRDQDEQQEEEGQDGGRRRRRGRGSGCRWSRRRRRRGDHGGVRGRSRHPSCSRRNC
jgi:hypothetical protein